MADTSLSTADFLRLLSKIQFDRTISTGDPTLGTAPAGSPEHVMYNKSTGNYVNFFNAFNKTSNPVPAEINDFINQYRNFASLSAADGVDIYNAFFADYKKNLNIDAGDFSNLVPPPTDAEIKQQFERAFTDFIFNYSYDQAFGTINTPVDFFSQWRVYLTATAFVDTSFTGGVTIAVYEQIYRAFFPDASDEAFKSFLTEFYKERLLESSINRDPNNPDGYFIPSRSLDAWFTKVQASYSQSLISSSGLYDTSVTTSATKKVLVLDRILFLIIEMISSIQRVAAAQANRLTFLSQWQRAYTDLANQIHFFGKNNGDEISNDDKDDLNNTNQTYTQQIQGNRSIISDDAKALQSNVNQSNDSVTQQITLADGIMQQFSTILSAIYR